MRGQKPRPTVRLRSSFCTLLAAGANVNEGPSSALQLAVKTGRLNMVEMLLGAKYDVNAPPGNLDLTALQLAAKFGHLEILERLLIAGAGVNAPAAGHGGFTALQAAALHGHLNVVRRLLSSHADVNAAPAKYGGCTVMQAQKGGGI
jgi:ankyrin repeat protein